MQFRISKPAEREMVRCQIPRERLDSVLARAPSSVFHYLAARKLCSRVLPPGVVLRTVVATEKEPPAVVTVYRTSRIQKYRSLE
jgi:hypothetical protein